MSRWVPVLIVDAHLDLAYNALRGRAVLKPAAEQERDEEGIPSVALPDLRRGGVALVCATIFCEPATSKERARGYTSAEEAHAIAEEQQRWYETQRDAAELNIITAAPHIQEIEAAPSNAEAGASPSNRAVPVILLMEGADPMRSPADVRPWFERGLRIVGLAWKRTRMAGGTGAPGPLTPEGVELVRELDRCGIIHELSHLAEQSFWELLEKSPGPVMASHSNCRAIVPSDRQLSDEMIRALVDRGGVIGINFFEKFLLPPQEYGKRRATLKDVVRHARHICDLAGNALHVGIGTDMDGGFGREQVPEELETSADLPKLAHALSAAGFSDDDVRGVLGQNWARFFRESLPR